MSNAAQITLRSSTQGVLAAIRVRADLRHGLKIQYSIPIEVEESGFCRFHYGVPGCPGRARTA